MRKLISGFIFALIFLMAIEVNAASIGERSQFYIDPNYDLNGREKLTAVLVAETPKIYFYIDENWWNFSSQSEIYQILGQLGEEFENRIYPTLTSTFGSEWKPGIDGDERITILFHPMVEDAGGYFRTQDEYPKIQIPNSNEREMVYLNANNIKSSYLKSLLAHEFLHLITFNQKEKKFNISEETWLNEARAEYAPTLLGYDDEEDSNLQKRIQIFIDYPSDPLIEWQNKKYDYGVTNLFIQYLVDHYGKEILVDSLFSPKTGVDSLNYALSKRGFKENFSQIFLDWTIAVLINDCNFGPKYCYLNKNLKDFYVVPQINFLPLRGKSTLTINEITKNWAGNWYKIIGGKGNLKFEFLGETKANFMVPYVLKNRAGSYNINFLTLDDFRKGEIYIDDFGKDIISLFIIPSVENEKISSTAVQPFYSFAWSVSTVETQEETELINRLLAQIDALKAEITKVRVQINAILAARGQKTSCSRFEKNLYFGIMNSSDVRCLQEFLSSEGTEIYPEGLITGNFLNITKEAVIRFQEKYANEILTPIGLEKGTGFVGERTRAKINEILGK